MNSIPDYWKPVKKRWLRRMGDVTADQALNEKAFATLSRCRYPRAAADRPWAV